MVSDFSINLLHRAGESELAAKRCVQCGEVVDAVIQRNRRLRQEPITVRQTEMRANTTSNRGRSRRYESKSIDIWAHHNCRSDDDGMCRRW